MNAVHVYIFFLGLGIGFAIAVALVWYLRRKASMALPTLARRRGLYRPDW